MGIETLREALLKEARHEAEQVMRQSQEQAKQMTEQEKAHTAAAKKQMMDDVEKALEAHRQERLAWAQLEAQRIIAEAREDAIKAAIDAVYEKLEDSKKSTEYKTYLNSAINQAVKELGLPIIVHLSKHDKTAIKAGDKIDVKSDWEDELGGAWMETADKKLRFNATLQAQIEAKHEELRKKIYEKLFLGEKTHGKAKGN